MSAYLFENVYDLLNAYKTTLNPISKMRYTKYGLVTQFRVHIQKLYVKVYLLLTLCDWSQDNYEPILEIHLKMYNEW